MPWDGPKKSLFSIIGPDGYRGLHAAWFGCRLLRALRSRRYAEKFFGNDLTAFAGGLKPGDTVLDIGAFLGGSTALFARAVGPTGRVIAFEPVHHVYLRRLLRLLRALRLIPALPRVEALALADRNGATELVVPIRAGVPLFSQAGFAESYPSASTASITSTAAAAAASTPAATTAEAQGNGYAFLRLPTRLERLDDALARLGILPESLAAVKIDVEGSELSVFAGAEDFLARFRGVLLCEFWFHAMPPPGWSRLRERGYACRYLDRQGRWFPADTPQALAEICRGETYGNFFLQKKDP